MADYFHFFEALINPETGSARIGYFVRLIDPDTLATVPIYADANGTPIESVSNETNMAASDGDGNLSFWVTPGTYHLDIYGTDATTFVMRVRSYGMTSTQGPVGPKGPPGSAGNVADSLAALKAALTTDVSWIYDNATFTWTEGDYTGLSDDINIIKSDYVDLSEGAWVRQGADKIRTTEGLTVAGALAARTPYQIGLFYELSPSIIIPSGVTLVQTSGYNSAGAGAARYALFDGDDTYISAHEYTSFKAADQDGNALYFRLAESSVTLDMFGGGSSGLAAALAYVCDDHGQPSEGVDGTNWNGSTTKRFTNELFIPAGEYTISAGAYAIANFGGVRLRGAGMAFTRIRLSDDDNWLFDSTDNVAVFDVRDLTLLGGKGLAIFRDDSSYSRGYYRVENCNLQDWTTAAIANLSSNFGRWMIRRNIFWCRGSDASSIKGIGVALRGMQDNSVIEDNLFHKARYGVKLGNGGYSITIARNSFMRAVAAVGGIQTDLWIVPDATEAKLGKATKVLFNRFGGENLDADDFRILVADETGAGDFIENGHSTAASTHRVDGLVVVGNEAAGPSNRPLVYSLVGRHKGWYIDNQLNGCPANIGYGADVTISSDSLLERSNVLGTVWAGLDKAVRSIALGAARRLWIIDDPIGLHVGEHLQDKGAGVRGPNWSYALDPNDGTAYVARGVGTTVSSASADFMGFNTKYTLTFAAANPSFGTSIRAHKTFDVNADDVGEVCWIEIWLEAADSHPLTQVNIGILPPSGGFAKKITATVPSAADTPIRIPWRPSVSGNHSLNIMPVDYVADEQDSVTVSRAAVYRNAEPIDTTDLTYKGWTLADLPASGAPFGTKAIVTDATSPTLGGVVTGAGSAVVTATFDGTNWRS